MPKRLMTREEMAAAFKGGRTQPEIAAQAGVSRQCVSKILIDMGVRRKNGGAFVRKAKRVADKAQWVRDRCFRLWGMDLSARAAIRAQYGYGPFLKYIHHRKNARTRGIAFDLSFAQWWAIWESSGKWAERRRGGYVMSRPGDKGPYAVGNILVVPQSVNAAEGMGRRWRA